jgi:hypothetical protein
MAMLREKSRPCRTTRRDWLLGVRRERDSPEVLRFIVLFDKLDCESGNSLKGAQLRDNAGRNQVPLRIEYSICNNGTRNSFSGGIDGRPTLAYMLSKRRDNWASTLRPPCSGWRAADDLSVPASPTTGN